MKQSCFLLKLFFLVLLPHNVCYAQADTLNQLNAKGKKNGYWKVYLDDKLEPVTSESSAYFYGYEYFDNGKNVFPFLYDKGKIVYNSIVPDKGKPALLGGTFRWYNENGILTEENVYKDGYPFLIKNYFFPKKRPEEVSMQVLYFDKQYNNTPGTCYYEEYYKGRLKDKRWYRNGENGWKVYVIEEQ